MRSNRKPSVRSRPGNTSRVNNASTVTAIAISKKLMEIKRISGAGEMTELNMALFRHLK